MRVLTFLFVGVFFILSASSQTIPSSVPVKRAIVKTDDKGSVTGRTYSNTVFGFSITVPDGWDVSAEYGKPTLSDSTIAGAGRVQLARSLERVKVLFTATRSASAGMIVTGAVEDLRAVPAVRDAVDYFDLMRSQFAVMKLPADFKYSETQAEKLGSRQFAFLDISSSEGKKRMYATLRRGHAVVFTLTYKKPDDLAAFRQILAGADFSHQN